MTHQLTMWGPVLALAWPGLAQAQVDLTTLDRGLSGPPAQILVLGTVHLSGLESFTPESLEPVLDRLAAFKPDVITIEGISGEQCDLMARYPTIYGRSAVNRYCRHTTVARVATGLDVPEALAAVHRALTEWPAAPLPTQRRHLAAMFLSAGDNASALVQWLELLPPEREAGDGLDDRLVALLDSLASRNNETYQLGARLAARLGLQRVFAIDDHSGDNIQVPDEAAYGKAIQQAWDAADAPTQPLRQHRDQLAQAHRMLALYRYINSGDFLSAIAESDFGAALKERSAEHYGRIYVGGWEARNLHMVANIRAAFREQPTARVLVIVGASHKPWFDRLLGLMQGVELVDAEQVLK